MKILKLNMSDLENINKLQQYRGFLPISDIKNWIIYGAYINNTLVGISCLFPYYRIPHTDYPNGYIAELGNTYVLPSYRNKGIATEIIQTMMNNLTTDLPNLDAVVADSTDDAYKIYKNLGFTDSTEYRIWKKL